MSGVFEFLCVVGLIFFLIVLIGCSHSQGKRRVRHQVYKVPQMQTVDATAGHRFWVHLERQMADFLTHHRHTAVMLLLATMALALAPAARAQKIPPAPPAAPGDQPVPAAVQKQLDAMQQRIEQLEAELKVRDAQPRSSGAAPDHSMDEQSSGTQAPPSTALLNTSGLPPKPEPFSFADFTWLNGNSRVKEVPFQNAFFTPEVRFDVSYIYDFNHPSDDTIGGSSEVFRHNEFQVTQAGVGGDFHYGNVLGRFMTQFGMYSQTTPRNDASPARGQWQLANAYRYVSEAYGGYHWDALDGVNVEAGIFMSYIGLFSYYNFDNWAYQPSYVSSNTPWFFNGMRVQIYPNEHWKIEPWLINGWQSYGRFNNRPGIGAQILWRPNGKFSFVGNQYILGEDTLGVPGRVRYHTDDSIQWMYYQNPQRTLDRMAFSLTGDLGCEHGGGVSCDTNSAQGPKQSFIGYMIYNRFWFHQDHYAVTLGGGQINNPGRYLVLLPPINGATAASGTPYFTQNPGDPFKAWDTSATFDYMPTQYVTFRFEYDHRAANVPYFSGSGGITPPGGNTGNPGSVVPGFTPDLRKTENRLDMALMVMF